MKKAPDFERSQGLFVFCRVGSAESILLRARALICSLTSIAFGARNEIKRLEGEKAYVVASGAKGGRDEVTILDKRIGAAQLLLQQLNVEKERLAEPYRVATTVGGGVLKALADEIGGGVNQAELFETMGWR